MPVIVSIHYSMCLARDRACTHRCVCVCLNMPVRDREFMDTCSLTLYDLAVQWTLSIILSLSPAPLHLSIPVSSHLLPIESLYVQTHSAGGMLNLFSCCKTQGDRDTRALLQVGLQLKNPLHFSPPFLSPFLFFFHSLPLPSFWS